MTPEERKNLILDYQKTFGSEEGQKVLADLSRECNEKRTTFVKGDQHTTAFLEGARAIMLYIRRLVEANPDEEKPTEALTEKDTQDG